MAPTPFRFGVTASRATSRKDWRRLARRAESLGYSSLLISDHFNDQLAPVPALAAAAEATTTLRVGSLVLCNDYRHPVVHAKDLATLDLLSDGRLEWGMGAGWFGPDYTKTGLVMEPAGVRVSRLIEAVRVMKGLFGPDAVTYAGQHYTVTDLDGTPKPVQEPHPPLTVGAAGPRMLQFAAREADVIGLAPSPTTRSRLGRPPEATVEQSLDQQLGWIREAAAERFDRLEVQTVAFPAMVAEGAELRAADVGRPLGLSAEEVLASPHVLLGSVSRLCDVLTARRQRWGISYVVVPAACADSFAPIVERLTET